MDIRKRQSGQIMDLKEKQSINKLRTYYSIEKADVFTVIQEEKDDTRRPVETDHG